MRDGQKQGTVRNLKIEAGFGFIRTSDGTDYFFHRTGVELTLGFGAIKEGMRVAFTPTINDKNGKPRAIEVRAV